MNERANTWRPRLEGLTAIIEGADFVKRASECAKGGTLKKRAVARMSVDSYLLTIQSGLLSLQRTKKIRLFRFEVFNPKSGEDFYSEMNDVGCSVFFNVMRDEGYSGLLVIHFALLLG